MDGSRIQSLPDDLKPTRDSLRCVGYELVHYTAAHAISVALPIRHDPQNYRFGFHKITGIYDQDVVIEAHTRSHCSRQDVPDYAQKYLEKERPATLGETAEWFKDPANLLLTLATPPFGLSLLGLGVLGNRRKKADQASRQVSLAQLADTPCFSSEYAARRA